MEVVVDDKGKDYDYHSCMSVIKPNYCTLYHVHEEEMLNRHETDLTTLIQGLYFNNKRNNT